MNSHRRIEINPRDLLSSVYEVVGEGAQHVQQFTSAPGFEWRSWCQDRSRMVPLIRAPLLAYWEGLSTAEKAQLKLTLQYILNIDEHVPYELLRKDSCLKQKTLGLGAKSFSSYQDTIAPYDYYEFCRWMWEIIFDDESWNADVSHWVVTDRLTLHSTFVGDMTAPKSKNSTSMLEKLRQGIPLFRRGDK